jgi:hypothetical protein
MTDIIIRFENVPNDKIQQVKKMLSDMIMDFGDGMDSDEYIVNFDVSDGKIIVSDS